MAPEPPRRADEDPPFEDAEHALAIRSDFTRLDVIDEI